jgi:hypothetical protein
MRTDTKLKNCFDSCSELIRLFVERVGKQECSPEFVMAGLIQDLRRSARTKGLAPLLEPYFKRRGIAAIEYVSDFHCDGAIEPLGKSFDSGFRITVRCGSSPTRIRFTAAHELCHTFFYEIVPELKFKDHEVDIEEERLCDFGAAELLMPGPGLRRQAQGSQISFQSLEMLSATFQVSLEAMLRRLRELRLWNAQLSVWHLMSDGNFSLHRLIGGRRENWTWSDPGLLNAAWDTRRVLWGRTYVEYRDVHGGLKLLPVSYELKRRGRVLLALWSSASANNGQLPMPLFDLYL